MKDESEPLPAEAAAAANKEDPVEQRSCQIDNCCSNEEDVIARETKSAVKELAMTRLSNMSEESLNDILKISLHNIQNRIQSIVSNVV